MTGPSTVEAGYVRRREYDRHNKLSYSHLSLARMTSRTITDEDEGKPVVNADRRTVGVVAGVRNGTPYVEPDPAITSSVMAKLGWDAGESGEYALDRTTIEAVTDDEVRLTSQL